jgi:hypothetical protein
MGHADIATTMIYVHHVPQNDAADKLSRLVAAAESVPRLRPVSGHTRDTIAGPDETQEAENGPSAAIVEWARLDSNQGQTDHESTSRDYRPLPSTTHHPDLRGLFR